MEGIEFSVAVAVGQDDKGKLIGEIPALVAERLRLESGDVLCWTGFANGSVEVWSVQKSPYASLGEETG